MASGGLPQWRAERLLGLLTAGGGCALKDSRVSCLLITLSSSSAPASLSRAINPISGRICSWVSSRSCSDVWAGTERVAAERRRLVMISPPCVLRLDNVTARGRSEGKRLGRLRPWRPLGGQACARSPSGLESIPARCNGLVALALSDGAASVVV